MHEASVAKAILDTALKFAPKESKKISTINVVTGAMSALSKDSLELYFNELSRGTKAYRATINIEVIPVSKTYIKDIEVEE